ncbi:hypothetical protein MTO96_035790 [Rhipicephalus appendiculatus]
MHSSSIVRWPRPAFWLRGECTYVIPDVTPTSHRAAALNNAGDFRRGAAAPEAPLTVGRGRSHRGTCSSDGYHESDNTQAVRARHVFTEYARFLRFTIIGLQQQQLEWKAYTASAWAV